MGFDGKNNELPASTLSINGTFYGKNILLTGATGFLGKVLLAIFLDSVSIGCIYVLIRSKNKKSALERFILDVLSSPAFEPLRQGKGEQLSAFLEKHIRVISGDVILPDLGITPKIAYYLHRKIDLVINSAGEVDFFAPVDHSFAINTKGAIHVAEFTRACDHAKLVHISTCYVADRRDGDVREIFHSVMSRSGEKMNPADEMRFISEEILKIKNQTTRKRVAQKALIALGKSRADYWGYNNTYCYTKALGEFALETQFPDISFSIARPSIIESAVSFPTVGWNEGFNTSAPVVYLLGNWYPYLVTKNEIALDIVPVDIVCRQIILIAAALLKGKANRIYQISSSAINPNRMREVIRYVRTWYQRNHRSLKTVKNLSAISPNFF